MYGNSNKSPSVKFPPGTSFLDINNLNCLKSNNQNPQLKKLERRKVSTYESFKIALRIISNHIVLVNTEATGAFFKCSHQNLQRTD